MDKNLDNTYSAHKYSKPHRLRHLLQHDPQGVHQKKVIHVSDKAET